LSTNNNISNRRTLFYNNYATTLMEPRFQKNNYSPQWTSETTRTRCTWCSML